MTVARSKPAQTAVTASLSSQYCAVAGQSRRNVANYKMAGSGRGDRQFLAVPFLGRQTPRAAQRKGNESAVATPIRAVAAASSRSALRISGRRRSKSMGTPGRTRLGIWGSRSDGRGLTKIHPFRPKFLSIICRAVGEALQRGSRRSFPGPFS